MTQLADVLAAYPEGHIAIREVGLRDGLQLTNSYPPTPAKAEWIAREYAAGLRHFEVGSFVPVSRMPQFADVRAIIDEVGGHKGAHGVALALNKRGAVDALQTDVAEITVVISASEAHNQANAQRSREKSLAEIDEVIRLRNASSRQPIISVGIAMAFGCPIGGPVAADEVMRIVDHCFDIGVDMVGLADTVGYAGPRQVTALCSRLRASLHSRPYAMHFHDTRGMGIANASAALDAGCRVIDASLGGLGGCPFAPGATGNIVLEDLIYLAETKGFDTGIDLDAVIKTRSILQEHMPDDVLHGNLAQAGPPSTLEWRANGA